MKRRYAYTISPKHAPHAHPIHGNTCAASEADLRLVLTSLYGHEAAADARVWEAYDETETLIDGRAA